MSCREIETLLALYVDDALTPVETRSVERHLETCATCRDLLASLRQDQRLLASLPMIAPPDGFSEALLQRLSAQGKKKPALVRYLLPRLSTLAAAIMVTLLASNLYLFPIVWPGQPQADEIVPMRMLSQAPEDDRSAPEDAVPFGVQSVPSETQPEVDPGMRGDGLPPDKSVSIGAPEGNPEVADPELAGDAKMMMITANGVSSTDAETSTERERWLWSAAVGLGLFGIGAGWFGYRYRRLV